MRSTAATVEKEFLGKKHLNLRIKRRRNTPVWPVALQRRDAHNYDFSGCKAGAHSCSLKGAPIRHVGSGGPSGAALLCCKTGILPSETANLLKRGSCPVLSLAWAPPRTQLWLGSTFPAPSLTFPAQTEHSGLCVEQEYSLLSLRVGLSFLSHLARRQGGCTAALGLHCYARKGDRRVLVG